GNTSMTKQAGLLEHMTSSKESPPSRKRKSPGHIPAPEPKKSKVTPDDTRSIENTGTGKEQKRWTSSTLVEDGTKPDDMRTRHKGGEDQVNGRGVNPITTLSPSMTPTSDPPLFALGSKKPPGTIKNGGSPKNLPQNPGGRI